MKEKKIQDEFGHGLKLLAKSSIIVFIGIFSSKIFSYLYRIIIARSLGPEVYGLFSLALMILSLFVVISSLGLTEGVLRFIALYRGKKEQDKVNFLFRVSLIIGVISGILFAIILFFSSEFISLKFFHNQSLIIYLKFFSFLIPVSLLTNFYLSVIRAYEEIGWHSFIQNILESSLKTIFLVIFIFFGLKTNAVISSSFLGITGMFLAAYFVCKYKIKISYNNPLKNKIKKRKILLDLFAYSWPLIFLGIIGNLFNWTDSFTIGYFKTVLDVGIYNSAVPIASLLLLPSVIFMQLFFPLITKEYSKKNFKLIKDLSQQVGKWIFLINLPLFLIIMLFPGVIINILFGQEYLIAENALRLLSLGFFSMSISAISTYLLSMMGKSKIILKDTLVFVGINLILNLILVPLYGLTGAAFSTMISYILFSSVLVYQANNELGIIPLRRKMIGIFLSGLISLTIIFILRKFVLINTLGLIMISILFVSIYILLVFLTKSLDSNDFLVLRGIKNHILRKTSPDNHRDFLKD